MSVINDLLGVAALVGVIYVADASFVRSETGEALNAARFTSALKYERIGETDIAKMLYQKSAVELEEAVLIDPFNASARAKLAIIYDSLGDETKAKKELETLTTVLREKDADLYAIQTLKENSDKTYVGLRIFDRYKFGISDPFTYGQAAYENKKLSHLYDKFDNNEIQSGGETP